MSIVLLPEQIVGSLNGNCAMEHLYVRDYNSHRLHVSDTFYAIMQGIKIARKLLHISFTARISFHGNKKILA